MLAEGLGVARGKKNVEKKVDSCVANFFHIKNFVLFKTFSNPKNNTTYLNTKIIKIIIDN